MRSKEEEGKETKKNSWVAVSWVAEGGGGRLRRIGGRAGKGGMVGEGTVGRGGEG